MSLFGLERNDFTEKEISFLVTAHGSIEAGIIGSILDAESIPYIAKQRGSGACVNILAGYSIYDIDMYVPSSVREKANELLEDYKNAEPLSEDEIVGEPEEDI